MCQMCEDESTYQLYLSYLDAAEKAGGAVDHDQLMAEVLAKMEEAARMAWERDPWAEDAQNDKTLSIHSPFICSPVDNK